MPADREPAQTSTREPDAVPHDPQDQQATPEDQESADHWDVEAPGGDADDEGARDVHDDVPGTDEAGTGRKGEDERREQLADRPEPQEPPG